jgi:predicted enzyme related to lactoylglutathione lyase
MVVKSIVHFEIPASDTERLKRFYGECFGWKFEDAKMPGMQYWMISTGPRGKSIGGGMFTKMSESDRPRNYIGVDKIDEAHNEIQNGWRNGSCWKARSSRDGLELHRP